MNLWIDIARDDLVAIIKRVDCLILNDEELRQLTGKPSLYTAAREIHGLGPGRPLDDRRQAGPVRRGAHHPRQLLRAPCLPDGDGRSTPPARATPSPGASSAIIASQAGWLRFDDNVLRNAMAYGTALASFNVQQFGTEALQTIEPDDVRARVADLWAMGRFDRVEPELRP